jgi:putative tricarboxylic transport membrane protein
MAHGGERLSDRAPAILGLVLGEMLEQNFMASMIKSDGAFLAFFERPIAGVLGVVTLLVWATMLWRGINRSVVSAGGQ